MATIPELFLDRLREILPERYLEKTIQSFTQAKALSVRVNTLKSTPEKVLEELKEQQLKCVTVPWYKEALILENAQRQDLRELPHLKDGRIYIQSLASMMVPLILNPRPGERVLDLCAAPGSKTSQMAALMQNQGHIVAVENVKERFYRLQSVCRLLDVKNASFNLLDGRRFRVKNDELFDKILLDAPCSCETRFYTGDDKTLAYWSLRKIKEMQQKQRGLLLHAGRLLKKGGALLYATCTFAPEENEAVVDWFLRKTDGHFQCDSSFFLLKGIDTYASLMEWQGKSFDNQIAHCIRVLPNDKVEGFFIAKLIRVRI